MDYAFLIYSDEAKLKSLSPEEGAQVVSNVWAVIDEATSRGVLKGVMRLQFPEEAKNVRNTAGSIVMTDGPFAETKEILGGFYLIDCKGDEEARQWASKLVQTGCSVCVEFRQGFDLLAMRKAMNAAVEQSSLQPVTANA